MSEPTARIPFSAPSGSRASALASSVVALSLFDCWALLVDSSPRGAQNLAIAALVVLLGSVLATRMASVGRSVAVSTLAGSLGTALFCALGREPQPVRVETILFGAIAGTFVGVMLAPAPASVAHARAVRSFDAFHAVLAASGVWLSIIGAALSAPLVATKGRGMVHYLLRGEGHLGEWSALVSLMLGIALTTAALVLQRRRLRWIADVYAERVPGWRIAIASEHPADASRWTLLESVRVRDGLLVRARAAGPDAFRSIAGVEPVAAVDIDPTVMLSTARQHATRLVAAVALVWSPVIAATIHTMFLRG